ncbi:hypothetical protein SAY86_011996 [Trapa natans]|uniref:apyrase n=1 Tax=Trapa natans TaxID=22666 RepID=A0AAN7M999_TRANT|nr:hypothetical protein SAY86_011996 [Trapa natans]
MINYLLGNLGRKYSDTVGVVDLGGGSVQMAMLYQKRMLQRLQSFLMERILMSRTCILKEETITFIHSYLHYGLLSARAEILKASGSENPCIYVGYEDKCHGLSTSSFSLDRGNLPQL